MLHLQCRLFCFFLNVAVVSFKIRLTFCRQFSKKFPDYYVLDTHIHKCINVTDERARVRHHSLKVQVTKPNRRKRFSTTWWINLISIKGNWIEIVWRIYETLKMVCDVMAKIVTPTDGEAMKQSHQQISLIVLYLINLYRQTIWHIKYRYILFSPIEIFLLIYSTFCWRNKSHSVTSI